MFIWALALRPKWARRFWAMSGPCSAYVGPMLALCWTMLGAWGPCCGHFELDGHVGLMWDPYAEPMLSPCWAKNGVFIWALALRPKWTRCFWVMSGLCWAYVGFLLVRTCGSFIFFLAFISAWGTNNYITFTSLLYYLLLATIIEARLKNKSR